MIDVVFLLLIFFLCASSFDRPEEDLAASLRVESAPAGASSAPAELPELDELIVAGRSEAGRAVWSVSGSDEVDAAGLPGLLAEFVAIDRALPVTIEAAPDVTLGQVVAAYDAARAAGFVTVRLAADADALAGAESQ